MMRDFFIAAWHTSRLLLVPTLLCALALLVWSPAHAASYPDQGMAFAACMQYGADWRAENPQVHSDDHRCVIYPAGPGEYRSEFHGDAFSSNPVNFTWQMLPENFVFGVRCDQRDTFAGDPASLEFAGIAPTCVAGCQVSYMNERRISTDNAVVLTQVDSRSYTGSTCGGLPPVAVQQAPPPTIDNPECTPAGDGQTFCIKPGGEQCTTTSNGVTFCWSPTEAGAKSTGTDGQTRNPGNTTTGPPPTPPSDQGPWIDKGGHNVNTTTVTTNTTTVTNVNSWGSSGSAPPLPPGPDTPPGEGDGEGEGDSDPATAGGDGTCAAVPTCSAPGRGMGAAECHQLVQTWMLRCKGVDWSGASTCDAPPTCDASQGDVGNCQVGRSLFIIRCGSEVERGEAGAAWDEAAAQSESEGEGPDLTELQGDAESFGVRRVDDIAPGLFGSPTTFLGGGHSCPTVSGFSVGPTSVQLLLTPFCTLLINIGNFVLALAYFKGAIIVSGGSK